MGGIVRGKHRLEQIFNWRRDMAVEVQAVFSERRAQQHWSLFATASKYS
jgi:hypothetical protein